MLKQITAIQENEILALEVVGKLEKEDYINNIHPFIDNATQENKKIKVLIHFGKEFAGFTPSAAWEDFKLGLSHWNSFEKLALVTDKDWLKTTTRFIATLMPGEVKVFADKELQDALNWIKC